MDSATWTFVILGAAMIGFVSGRVPVAIVAVGVAVSLWATGVLTLPEAFAGFGNPAVVFVASLFVVIEALDATGITAWLAQIVMGFARSGRFRFTIVVCLVAALLSALISVTGTVAALVPVIVVAAVRAGFAPSKMLIPLALFAISGSLLTLTASPINIVVSEAAEGAGGRRFGFFEFVLVGVPLVLLTFLIVLIAGNRLLPSRPVDSLATPDRSAHARSLRQSYNVDTSTRALFTPDDGVAEVLIAPRSTLIGRRVYPGMTTRNEGLVILGVRRGESASVNIGGDESSALALEPGDAVLVQGPWEALNRYVASPDVIAVTEPEMLKRAVPLGKRSKRVLVIFGLMIVLLATGLVPAPIATLLAAGALILTRVVAIPQIYRTIPWSVVILMGGMIALSTAFTSTGAAARVADAMLGIVGGASPLLALLAVCALTLVLSQFLSGLATVLIVAPIAIALAESLGVSVQPFMMALAVAGSTAFMTLVATPANALIMKPGGYRPADYWKLGIPVGLAYLAVAVLYVPLIWPF